MTATSRTTPVSVPVCDRESSAEDLYGAVYAIRLFEQSLLDLFGKGGLAGTTHTCLGQEATAVGVLAALDKSRDIVFSNHRGHGHFLAYCGLVEQLYLEVFGKPGGVCGGRGGSQHLHFRNFYSNGIQGGIVPVSTGIALREKIERTGAVTVVFLGDGTLGEGVAYKAFNIASLWSLPVLFVIDDNQYAQSTPKQLQLAGSMRDRLEAFGIGVDERETTDAREVGTARARRHRRGAARGPAARPGAAYVPPGPAQQGRRHARPGRDRGRVGANPSRCSSPRSPPRGGSSSRGNSRGRHAARESALNAAPYPPRGGS